MRERVTYVHGPEDAFDPKQLLLKDETLHIQHLHAAREIRLTFGLYELPQEVPTTLTSGHWRRLTGPAMESLKAVP